MHRLGGDLSPKENSSRERKVCWQRFLRLGAGITKGVGEISSMGQIPEISSMGRIPVFGVGYLQSSGNSFVLQNPEYITNHCKETQIAYKSH